MKLSKYFDDYYFFSGKASEVARSISFAGIAIIWVFKVDGKPVPHVPSELLLPAGLLVAGLAVDLLHYIVGTAIWGLFAWYQEKKKSKSSDDPEISHWPWLQTPLTILFWTKMALVIAAYYYLGNYVWSIWVNQSAAS